MKMKKMAVLTVVPEVLRELLCLPPGTTLVDMQVPFERPGVLELKIEGSGWDTPEGSVIMRAPAAEIIKEGSSRIAVDWKLPSNDGIKRAALAAPLE